MYFFFKLHGASNLGFKYNSLLKSTEENEQKITSIIANYPRSTHNAFIFQMSQFRQLLWAFLSKDGFKYSKFNNTFSVVCYHRLTSLYEYLPHSGSKRNEFKSMYPEAVLLLECFNDFFVQNPCLYLRVVDNFL